MHGVYCGLGGAVNCLMVYISEAHAADEWPISSSRYNGGRGAVVVAQHRTTAERCAAARAFMADFGVTMPLLVDPLLLPEDDGRCGFDVAQQDGRQEGEQAPSGPGHQGCNQSHVGKQPSQPFDDVLAPWPVRFYLLDARTRRLLYASQPHAAATDPFEVEEAVRAELAARGVAPQPLLLPLPSVGAA